MSRVAALPLKTTTAEALLGMLSLRPMSGYEIRQTIEWSVGNFWQESYGQIYPTLKRLVKDGFAEAKEDGSRGRAVYRLTAAGRKQLRAWLKTPSRPQVWRNEMLLKIFFAGQGGPGTVRSQVEAFRELHAGELRKFAQIRTRLEREYARHPELPYWRMTLAYGECESRAMVTWCDRTLAKVTTLEEVADAS